MNRISAYVVLAACTAAIMPLSQAHAAVTGDTATVDASAQFRAAIVLTSVADMDFTPAGAFIDLSGVSDTTSIVTLNPDTTMAASGGSYFANVPANGQVGEVDIAGTTGQPVEINCSTGAVMTPGAVGDPIELENVMFSTAALGASPVACPGVDPAAPVPYTLGAGTDHILLGGEIHADGGGTGVGVAAGAYSSTDTAHGGVPITVQVSYQ